MTGELVPPPRAQTGPRWHLSLLGGVRLQDAATLHTRFATRAITALLARLALWPQRVHAREELIELLWPGVDPATGRRRLRQALSLLRAVLEPPNGAALPVLQADRLSVRVLPGTVACDVHHFEAQCRAAQREPALASYAGELMPGFYDEWIHAERSRLASLHERLLATTKAAEAPGPKPTTGWPPPAAPLTLPALSTPALRTTLPGYLTRYFAHPPQMNRLLAQVQAHRLVTLLGPGGSGKTRLAVALARQLGEPAPDFAATGLPAAMPPPPFDLVLFVLLATVHSTPQLVTALQTALQIGTADPAVDTVVRRLEGVKALLVLDNAEQLAGLANSVIDQLTGALPRLHLLVTSRCRLGVDGERGFAIGALPVPPAGAPLAQAAASPAVALFVDRACAVRLDFHLSERNHTAVVDLVRALQGMPLAIELAACRIRAFSPAQMLGKLGALVATPGQTPGLDLLSRPQPRSAPQSRHASMQRAIAWSWQQLDADHQRLAAAMAVFPGGCDAAMLASVHAEGDVAAGLEQLQAYSLAHPVASGQDLQPVGSPVDDGLPAAPGDGAPGDGAPDELASADLASADGGAADEGYADDVPRLSLYEPIREYAAAQVDAALTGRWRARQRAWAVAWLRALPATPPLARVRAELVNLSAALATAAADAAGDAGAAGVDDVSGAAGAAATHAAAAAGADAVHLLLAWRALHEGVTLPADTLAQARIAIQACADPSLRARGLAALAPLLLTAGDMAQARQLAEAAVAAAPPGDVAHAWALLAQAGVHWRGSLSPPPLVLAWVDQALGHAEQHADPDLLAALFNLKALVLYGQGPHSDPDASRSLAARALALWDGLGNRHGVNQARHNVAVYDFQAGRRDQALALWDAIAAEAAVLQDTRRLAIADSARCTALSDLRRWPQARQALRDSLRQSWQAMRLYEVAYDLWNLPRVLAHLRRPDDAQCLMAFAAQFWASRFGPLAEADRRHVHLVERLVARQLDKQTAAAAAARGRHMALGDAVALALAG